ncbi:MAG: peptidoglycan DD-metalloendopeptidase family protein [Flavobacteriales bacterium]|nr:peptidoglycan DD-metalloendopeptidase family protein [Flavobacteriales bacterium]
MKVAHLLLTLSMAFGPWHLLRGQSDLDTLAIGGAEEIGPYEDMDVPELIDGNSDRSLLEREDSLSLIPGYQLYGGWNTESIFGRTAMPLALKDTVRLCLSNEACDHAMPVCGDVTSPFGPRRGRMHYGIDLELDNGDPVVAAFEGMVRISRYNSTFGNVVVVRHSNGLETLYAHLSQRNVEPGDHVEAGDMLGLGGSTGRSTGDHLHFEVRYLDQPIDPQQVFDVQNGELKTRDFDLHAGVFAQIAKAKAESARTKYHTVRRGDTLSSIARRNGTSVARLCKINRISTRSKLRVGQRIRTS